MQALPSGIGSTGTAAKIFGSNDSRKIVRAEGFY